MNSQACVLEIRAISGLTWREIAGIFEVNQRMAHQWALGEKVSPEHERKLREVHEKLLFLHNGDAEATASRLRSVHGGVSMLSQLGSIPLASILNMGATQAHRGTRVVDQATLMANWRPVAPFLDRWDDESIEDVVPVGNYPVKLLRVASKSCR